MEIKVNDLINKLEKDFGWSNLHKENKNSWFVESLLKDTIQAIEVIHSCEKLKDKHKTDIKGFKKELLEFRKWQFENDARVYLYEDEFMVDKYIDYKSNLKLRTNFREQD